MRLPLVGFLTCLSLNLFNFEENTYYDVSANPVIVDLDFCTDVDDAVAIRMATELDKNGVGSLKAVGLCTTDKEGTDVNLRAAHGILCYEGYDSVPIGISHDTEPDESPYWDVCASYSDGNMIIKDSVELYKDVLRSCANKVTIVTTGYVDNIASLLRDEEGYNLVRDNCSKIVITGGALPSGWSNNFNFTQRAGESIKYVSENAPCDIVYVLSDVGGVFNAGKILQDNAPDDPVSKAITAFGSFDGRAAWDPTAVFISFVPEAVSNFSYYYCTTSFDDKNICSFELSDTTTNKKVVRRKDSISLEQYQNLIEGVLASNLSLD